MKRTYSAAGDHWNWFDNPRFRNAVATATVIEAEEAPRFSGLLDASGTKLMVKTERERIGFVHF